MRKMINLKTYLLISVVLVTLWTAAASADVIYVDAGAATGGDGSTWTKAYIYLQDALNDPCLAIGDEIWVAAETYKPDTSSAYPGGTGSRYATFYLGYGVALYGGFPAGGGDWEQRDPGTNETILSGDIGMWLNNQDNSFHVVTGNGVNPTAILDGFTITAGNAHSSYYYEDRGGGMYNYNYSNPTVINCTFRGNSAYRYGGGIYNEYSNPTVINCTFSGNSAIYGGGMCNYDHSNPMVINCIFRDNHAMDGGAVYNYHTAKPEFINCLFMNNSAVSGGAVMDNVGPSATYDGCTFKDNSSRYKGGALFLDYGSRPLIRNCSFENNRAGIHGGAIYTITRASQLESTVADIEKCVFIRNSSGKRGGAVMNFDNSYVKLNDCTFKENSCGSGGGAIATDFDAETTISNCVFEGNSAGSGENDIDRDDTGTVKTS